MDVFKQIKVMHLQIQYYENLKKKMPKILMEYTKTITNFYYVGKRLKCP
jgi:hypothetical protein